MVSASSIPRIGHAEAMRITASENGRLLDQLQQLGLEDWGSVDLYGVTISGPAWREGLVSDRQVTTWAKSPGP